MAGTFNDRQIQNNLEKAAPALAAELNKCIFNVVQTLEEDDTITISFGEWVVVQQKLTHVDDPGARHVPPAHRLEPMDVIYQILGEERGTRAWLEIDVPSEGEE